MVLIQVDLDLRLISDWIKKIQSSTDMHFPSFQTQWTNILTKLPKDDEGNSVISEGDVFITKHSNLPHLQVVFHLIVADKMTDLNSSSSTLKGYKLALQIAHEHHVQNLTIPLLLYPTSYLSGENNEPSKDQTRPSLLEALIFRRSESILKVTKALMTEYNRAKKHSEYSLGMNQESKMIQFLMPTSMRGLRSDVLFVNVRDKLAELFKTL
jgi:hypothetical protein